jgi:hypothetical protein
MSFRGSCPPPFFLIFLSLCLCMSVYLYIKKIFFTLTQPVSLSTCPRYHPRTPYHIPTTCRTSATCASPSLTAFSTPLSLPPVARRAGATCASPSLTAFTILNIVLHLYHISKPCDTFAYRLFHPVIPTSTSVPLANTRIYFNFNKTHLYSYVRISSSLLVSLHTSHSPHFAPYTFTHIAEGERRWPASRWAVRATYHFSSVRQDPSQRIHSSRGSVRPHGPGQKHMTRVLSVESCLSLTPP